MRIYIAIDSFKGSISSLDAGNTVKQAILEIDPSAQVTVNPLADGGEGTVNALANGLDGEIIELSVCGPLGDPVSAKYCILQDHTAVIEMSAAAGITLVDPDKRNPMHTTTYGVGQLIHDALSRGCRRFLIGIGGSATNDGGVGMLSALGFSFLNSADEPIEYGAKGLQHLAKIDTQGCHPALKDASFRIACDVCNPLCGEQGCSAIYGPQKGATKEEILSMDCWLDNYANLAATVVPKADPTYPGTGAAGGMGFAFLTFLNATLEPGVAIVLEQIHAEEQIAASDLVITGEGRLDAQTTMGKAPIGIANLAKKYNKPVIAFAGCITDDTPICNEYGIDAYFPIIPGVVTLDQALNTHNARQNLKNTAIQVYRLLNLAKSYTDHA